MIKNIQNESKKIPNLSNEDAVKFLISNNIGIDSKIYEIIRQMVFSQVHLDEHIQYLCSKSCCDLLADNKKTFCEMLNEVKNLNFEKLNIILSTLLEDSVKIDKDELKEYLLKQKNGNEEVYQIWNRLEESILRTYKSTESAMYSWEDIKNWENQRQSIAKTLSEVAEKLEKMEKEQKEKGILQRIKEKLFKRDKIKCFKTERQSLEEQKERLTKTLQDIETKLEEENRRYKSPEELKSELLKILDMASYMTADGYNRRKIQEIISSLKQENDLENNVESYIPPLYKICHNLKGSDDFNYWSNEAFKDIGSQLKMTLGIFDGKNLQSEDLISLIDNIRKQMMKCSVISDHELTTKYRTKSLGKSKYIIGTNYNAERITEEMNKLNTEFKRLKSNDNIEDYIRGCADIFQKFLMIHPFMDGNGRTSRIMLMVILAQRNIFIPNIYDTYLERDKNSMFMRFGDEVAINGNFKLFQDYLLARVQRYNPNLIDGDYSYLSKVYTELLEKSRNLEGEGIFQN